MNINYPDSNCGTLTINAPNGDGVILSVPSGYPSTTGVSYKLDPGTCAQKTPCQATLTATPSVIGSFNLYLSAYDPLTGLTSADSSSSYSNGTAGSRWLRSRLHR